MNSYKKCSVHYCELWCSKRNQDTLLLSTRPPICLLSLHFVILMLVVKESPPSQCIQFHPMEKSLKHSMGMLWNVELLPMSGSPEGSLASPVDDGRGCEALQKGHTTGQLGNSTHTWHSGAQRQWDLLIAFSTFLDLGPCLLEHRKYLSLAKDRWLD